MSHSDVTLTCPKCKRPFTVPGTRFETEAEFECSSCGHVFESETDHLQPALDRIEKKLRGMQDLL